MFGVDDPVPVVVFCEPPVLVLGVVGPPEVLEPGCVVELEALADCEVPGVVDVAEGTVEVVVEGELSVGSSTLVPEPLGVAPPPLIIVEVPPVCCDLSLVGTATEVVEVVTVVGVVADGAGAIGAIRVCGRNGGAATAGAASSGGSALEYVTGAGTAGATWWLAGAIRAGRA